ncbi:CBS domain-containing protein [Solitalea koreensis]|uniref:CBS domain-containing protein n=1 Tax=Solitalea koreensis TaxID=543615 RepID=A0A521D0L5_9SPHI|nr:CBS domain-containing protein [Solitalea koreensis]SMO65208.1 CBS domain-containing protein [Solitalea koreensis]
MLASELVSDFLPPLKTSDTAQKALERMSEFHVSHLPVVNETEFLGLVCDNDIVELVDLEEPIGNTELSLSFQSINENQHVYDVIRLINEQSLTIVPVVDNRNRYTGVITATTLIENFAKLIAVDNPGGIIVLESTMRDFSLAEIARIVESNDASILSSYISTFSDSTRIEVTLKINKTDLTPILASFQRFNYSIKATFFQNPRADDTMDRFDSFMHYLNI